MPKSADSSLVLKTLQKANSIRAKAEKKAKKIERKALRGLQKQREKLLEQVTKIDNEIARISGSAVAAATSPATEATSGATGKGKRQRLEQTILEIVKESGQISCAGIEGHAKMVSFYAPDEVPSQAIKLKSLVKQHKLKKEGERKKAVYLLPK